MASNTNLSREMAVKLLKGEKISCPACGKENLVSRYGHRNPNTEYKCPACGEIYHPCKLI